MVGEKDVILLRHLTALISSYITDFFLNSIVLTIKCLIFKQHDLGKG